MTGAMHVVIGRLDSCETIPSDVVTVDDPEVTMVSPLTSPKALQTEVCEVWLKRLESSDKVPKASCPRPCPPTTVVGRHTTTLLTTGRKEHPLLKLGYLRKVPHIGAVFCCLWWQTDLRKEETSGYFLENLVIEAPL